MEDRSKIIFGNSINDMDYKKAINSKEKFIKKFGDDSACDDPADLQDNEYIGDLLGVKDIRILREGQTPERDINEVDNSKSIIVGNIRMGFGHYRISMAMASAANAMGYTPYWMDLNSYDHTTCTKVISSQNDLYSLGSRISQKSKAFNKAVWEPVNYEGFRKLSYNSSDQKNAELMATVFKNIPKDIPFIGTHTWPSQAAIHAGMKRVVNAIPDNWPMALHLAEGSIHTVQTHQAYQGYRILNGMEGTKILKPMPKGSLVYTGHYIDAELVDNIETDCDERIKRYTAKKPMRFLLTIGGAGAQKDIFVAIIKYVLPLIKKDRVALFVNVGDYLNVWNEIVEEIPEVRELASCHFNDWEGTRIFAENSISDDVTGIHAFYHENIFEAVYCTNLLMRCTDVLVTKPSELAFYPIPKIFIKRIGGHEKWGAIHSAEIGDGTLECSDIRHTLQMVKLFIEDEDYIYDFCRNIKINKSIGIYDGAKNVVKLALGL